MTVRIRRGDCLDMLKTLPDESVHCCVTSPPYWGLRDYGIPPSVWGGDPTCAHEWGPEGKKGGGSHTHTTGTGQNGRKQIEAHEAISSASTGNFCSCGAWRGCLGLEPTPELFVAHMVEVFQEVRRVLRADGTLWLNLGDCYATGAGAVGNSPGGGVQGARWAGDAGRHRDATRRDHGRPAENGRGEPQVPAGYRGERIGSEGKHGYRADSAGIGPMTQPNRMPIPGLKPKDMVLIPERVVLGLQADGWWVRSRMPWLKRNSMPESVTDRPATATEYVFLLSKSERYFYDREAVKSEASDKTHERRPFKTPDGWDTSKGEGGHGSIHKAGREKGHVPGGTGVGFGHGYDKVTKPRHKAERKLAEPGSGIKNNASFDAAMAVMPGTRNRRNSDWFIESWQGLLTDEAGDPLALIVNPARFSEAHFATFPPKLIEPMIAAGTSERGCCDACGAPWVRIVDVVYENPGNRKSNGPRSIERKGLEFGTAGFAQRLERKATTTGWQPTCDCYGTEPLPEYPDELADDAPVEVIDAHVASCAAVTAERRRLLDAWKRLNTVPAVVMDIFGGAGTTGLVADRLGRHAILIELKPEYADIATRRIVGDAPLFTEVSQ